MKNVNFFLKLFSVLIIAAALGYYQTEASQREAVISENESAVREAEEANQAILKEKEEINRAFEQAKNELEGRTSAETEEEYFYQDGTFEGSGMGFGGNIVLSVTIEKDVITDVTVLSHDGEDEAYYILAEPLADEIVKQQSIEVDTVSGATLSSGGILAAARDALEKAVNR